MYVAIYVNISVVKEDGQINWDHLNVGGLQSYSPTLHCIRLRMYGARVPSIMQSVIDCFIPVWPFKVKHNSFNALCCWLSQLIWYNKKSY